MARSFVHVGASEYIVRYRHLYYIHCMVLGILMHLSYELLSFLWQQTRLPVHGSHLGVRPYVTRLLRGLYMQPLIHRAFVFRGHWQPLTIDSFTRTLRRGGEATQDFPEEHAPLVRPHIVRERRAITLIAAEEER